MPFWIDRAILSGLKCYYCLTYTWAYWKVNYCISVLEWESRVHSCISLLTVKHWLSSGYRILTSRASLVSDGHRLNRCLSASSLLHCHWCWAFSSKQGKNVRILNSCSLSALKFFEYRVSRILEFWILEHVTEALFTKALEDWTWSCSSEEHQVSDEISVSWNTSYVENYLKSGFAWWRMS